MPQPAPVVQPSPVPMTLHLRIETRDGKGLVRLEWLTPQGTTVLYLDPDTATGVGQGIVKAAQQARTGLVIPNGKVISA